MKVLKIIGQRYPQRYENRISQRRPRLDASFLIIDL
jgi:hypothetical protein